MEFGFIAQNNNLSPQLKAQGPSLVIHHLTD